MFKDIQQGITKFFTSQRILLLVIFFVLAWGLLAYSGSKTMVLDKMETGAHHMESLQTAQEIDHPPAVVQEGPKNKDKAGYSMQPVANPQDLLPKDNNSKWAALNPSTMTQGNVLIPDLLKAGYHIGLDTIGQSLRNANLQLRSDPVIPKSDVGPWNQSTIEPDLGRVPLEIGQGQR